MKIFGYEFQFASQGTLQFDPGMGTKLFEPNWCIMLCDEEIARYYKWLLQKEGIEIHEPNKIWKFHASVIKGEEPRKNMDKWKQFDGKKITFNYGSYISYSNGRHAWISCYCDELSDIRDFYGLETNGKKLKYHMTLGRLKNPTQPDTKRPGAIYNDGDNFLSI